MRSLRLAAGCGLLLAAFNFVVFAQTCSISSGCLDPDFAGGSLVRVPNAGDYGGNRILRLSNGQIVVLAIGSHISEGQYITKLNPDGTVDTAFAGNGTLHIQWKVTQRKDTYYGSVSAIALQNVGGSERLLVAGTTPILSGSKLYGGRLRIERYKLTDGSLDTSWDGDGSLQSVDLAGAGAMIVQPLDQKIIFANESIDRVTRLTATGQLDTTFGSGGSSASSYPNYLVLDSSGRLLVEGWVNTAPNRGGLIITPSITRYTTNGIKDTSFGNKGTALAGYNTRYLSPMLSVDATGNVLISSSTGPTDAATDFVVERFTDSGIPDISFGGGDGIATVDFYGQRDLAMASTLQSDGSIVIVGNTAVAGSTSGADLAMARIDSFGNLDPTFGTGGRIMFPHHTPGGEAFSSILMVTDPTWGGERFYAAGANAQTNELLVARFLEH